MERCKCGICTCASLLLGASVALGLSSWTYGQDCGAGDVSSAEACLVDDDVDTINGGCNSDPAVFESANVGGSISGTVSTYLAVGECDDDDDCADGEACVDGMCIQNRRDTDWYLVTAEELAAADRDNNGIVRLSHSAVSEAPIALFIVDIGDTPCAPGEALVIGQTGFAGPDCAAGAPSEAFIDISDHPHGIAYWVGTANPDTSPITSGYECATGDNDYVITMELTEPFTECGPGNGACNQANGTGGCDDVGCCQLVCDIDPACCLFEWDNFCVGIAEGLGCLPEPIISSLDGLWTADIREDGQIENFFTPAQPEGDNVWETIIYEANSETNDMLSRRVDTVNYTIVSNTTISPDGTTATTVLEADDVDLTMEIEHTMLNGLSGGALTTIRCENTGNVPISAKIFYYCDFDVGADFFDDEAVTIPDPPDPLFVIEQIDNSKGDDPLPLWFGACPDYAGWAIATWAELRDDLDAGIAELANEDTTPRPGGGGDFDHTAAVSGPMTLLQPGEIVELQAGLGGVDFDACGAPPELCTWDLSGDGLVDGTDLIILLGSWGDPYGTADLIELLGAWGPCPE